VDWDLQSVIDELGDKGELALQIDDIVQHLQLNAKKGDYIVVMSNGGFGGIHEKILQALGA